MLAVAFTFVGCASHTKPSIFTSTNRPRGYNWTPARAATGDTVWYGTDPETRKTVYVGPDGIYYIFDHKPPIRAEDLKSKWDPHDVRVTPAP